MNAFTTSLELELQAIRDQSLWKVECEILSSQSAHIAVAGGRRVLNFCANNYLGLANHPALIAAAKDALDSHGFGMASVRFICGTTALVSVIVPIKFVSMTGRQSARSVASIEFITLPGL